MPALNVPDAIVATNRRFMAAFERRDAAAAADVYTAEAQILPPHHEPLTGRDAIRGFWERAMAQGVTRVTLESVEFVVLGEIAVELGRYALGSADTPSLDDGKYCVVWHREGDAWRWHRDIWNSNRPAG